MNFNELKELADEKVALNMGKLFFFHIYKLRVDSSEAMIAGDYRRAKETMEDIYRKLHGIIKKRSEKTIVELERLFRLVESNLKNHKKSEVFMYNAKKNLDNIDMILNDVQFEVGLLMPERQDRSKFEDE